MNTGLRMETVEKKMKYSITDFAKEFNAENALKFNSGFGVPAGRIDNETNLLRGISTNPRFRQDLGALPLATLGGRTTNGPMVISDMGRNKKSCEVQQDNHYTRIFKNLSQGDLPKEYIQRAGEDSRSKYYNQ